MWKIIRKIWRTGIVTKTITIAPPVHVDEKDMLFGTQGEYGAIERVDLEVDLQRRIKQVLGGSLHIRHVDSGSCNGCDFEMTMLNSPVYDIQQYGVDFVASPRHADMLMVTGGVTRNLEEALRKTYAATATPKMVVAVGECACSGGMVGRTYANYGGVEQIVPVYVNVPGCPPTPQALIEGILLALERYEQMAV